MDQVKIRDWNELKTLSESERTALAFGEAEVLLADGRHYRRVTGEWLDMHYVIDLGGDESDVHDLFLNVEDERDLHCLRCGAIDADELRQAYRSRPTAAG